ncbi:hypothetical protein [Nostoc sp.]|uniref:alpha/beta fold hydrolase n=1 Tax=Nostoc sp. TaxID=1180 RepID=UPI002FF371BC
MIFEQNITEVIAAMVEDRAINPELERFMAKRINAQTTEIKSSHVAFISHPKEVVKLIEQAATVQSNP